ncbi:M4 family metallopeptidase [Bacillus cereus]
MPQYLLEKLAKEGSKEAAETLAKTASIKEKKKIKTTNEVSVSNRTEKKPNRFIYDCKNRWDLGNNIVRQEGQPPIQDEDVNIAYDNCGHTLEYFKKVLNRNSIDDQGMDIHCFVNYGEDYENALWNEDSEIIIFGDGDGSEFVGFARSIDVVAHEAAHAITHYVNQLDYEFQAGALNEHFSDVIGCAVQQHIKGQSAETADWLVGNEIVGPAFRGKALRSMKEPGTAFEGDIQPSHMNHYVDWPIEQDNGGVHINSGIPNKAFFLVALEIGTDSAAFLWYTAWKDQSFMKPKAEFRDAFESILNSAQVLSSQGKLPSRAVAVVKNAFREVGINSLAGI